MLFLLLSQLPFRWRDQRNLWSFLPPTPFAATTSVYVQVCRLCKVSQSHPCFHHWINKSNSQLSSCTLQRKVLLLVMWQTPCRFQTSAKFCTTFCHFLTILNWLQTTWDRSPISKSNHCATLINGLVLIEALKDNKAAIQKYLYIYSLNSFQVKATGQGMMRQIQL